MRVLSLFDGISCGRVALERAGIKVDEYVAFETDETAIKISKNNYPDIVHEGDVYTGNFYKYRGFDLVIGGSPCTYWSIARTTGGRETTSSGIGFELFMQYLRAIKEVSPKYFLYENNKSISEDIKNEISDKLGVDYIMINSSLVSGQDRKRCYWTNIPNVNQPTDKNILFKDVIKKERNWFPILPWSTKYWGGVKKLDTLRTVENDKSFCLTTNKSHPKNYYLNKSRNMMTKLDADEAEILQTLPLGYTRGIVEGKRFKAIGNGWTVDVIAHILGGIKGEAPTSL